MKKVIVTDKAPKPVGPYSQAIQMGDFLFCSGQISLNPETNELELGSITEQTQLVMKNVGAVLSAAEMDYSNIIKTTIFLTDMNDFAEMNSVYETYFNESPPARSCVAAKSLPKGVHVEIEVLAHA